MITLSFGNKQKSYEYKDGGVSRVRTFSFPNVAMFSAIRRRIGLIIRYSPLTICPHSGSRLYLVEIRAVNSTVSVVIWSLGYTSGNTTVMKRG